MARVRQVARDGLTFDVRDAGPRDGEVALLLHGFPQDSSAWDPVAATLHGAGIRTLAPDQRGYSPGARPTDRAAYRMSELVLDALAVLDAADVERAHLVGHDWGGSVVWALAGRHTDRALSATVLSTPHPAAFSWSLFRSTQGLRSTYMAAFQVPAVPERVLCRIMRPWLERTGLPADDAARYAARMDRETVTAALGWYRALSLSSREPYPHVRVPTTYVWGRHDPALGRAAAERTRDLVSAPYRFVELDAGHWLPETRPVQVSTVLLDQVRAALSP
jgi:pimeloyl-ACP methyl ester carboxylesterase